MGQGLGTDEANCCHVGVRGEHEGFSDAERFRRFFDGGQLGLEIGFGSLGTEEAQDFEAFGRVRGFYGDQKKVCQKVGTGGEREAVYTRSELYLKSGVSFSLASGTRGW